MFSGTSNWPRLPPKPSVSRLPRKAPYAPPLPRPTPNYGAGKKHSSVACCLWRTPPKESRRYARRGADLLKTQSRLEQRARARTDIRPIPTPLTDSYIKEVQKRLREKAIFAKREFLTEIVKEIRVRDKQVTVTYRLPWTPQVLAQIDRTGRFFTVSKWWSQ